MRTDNSKRYKFLTPEYEGPIWLLPTRGRPELCLETIKACEEAGMTSPLFVLVDTENNMHQRYLEILPDRLPGFIINIVYKRLDLQATKKWLFDKFPHCSQYGLICDDILPITPQFDKKMEALADNWYLTDCNDQWIVLKSEYDPPYELCGVFCWGGKLVRAVGWWGFPYVRQAGNDDAWNYLCQDLLNLRKHNRSVIVEHKNWRTGKREKDETDNWIRNGETYIENDFKELGKWLQTEEPLIITERIRKQLNAA